MEIYKNIVFKSTVFQMYSSVGGRGGGGITPICTVFGLSLNVTLVIDFELG